MKRKLYSAKIDSSQIYDGDTIERVKVMVYRYSVPGPTEPALEVWPGIFISKGGVEVEVNVRLEGIDAPEIHPHHTSHEGIKRTQESVDKEKVLAQKSKQALIDFLAQYEDRIYLEGPQLGKYAGRIVANLFVKDENDKMRSVSNYMLQNGYAKPYFGGHKEDFVSPAG